MSNEFEARKSSDRARADATPIERIPVENVREILPALIDALTDAVVVVDATREVVAVNRRYVDIFGERRADVAGSACTEKSHVHEEGELPRCAACEVIESRAPVKRLAHLPDELGTMRRWEGSFSPVAGARGEVTHVVEVWREITDRSQLEVQLSHSERLASVGILSAGVAHEINNPLASMLACAEALSRWLARGRFEPQDLSEAKETIDTIDREIDRCRDTTQKLMLLGRSFDTAPSWVDLNLAVQDTLSLLRYEMRKRNVEAVEDLDRNLEPIWAREGGMRGVCMNLMMNAVQAMESGGRLTVSTRRGTKQVTMVVEDNGPGIRLEDVDQIWDPFFTTKPVGQGTGLGLSITSGIVTRHGGRIRFENAPGHGARFIVELPLRGTGGDA